MSKISCDVNKDLLASYLDGICSEESRGLVEEHLKECVACRKFVEQIQEQDLGKDAVKVDFLKRVKRSMAVRSWVAVGLALLLVCIGHQRIRHEPLSELLYYISMPIFMLTGALITKGSSGKSRPAKKEWLIPALGAALACVTLGVQAMVCILISDLANEKKVSIPIPQNELGPYLEWFNTGIIALWVVLFAISLVKLKGRRSISIVSQNIAWLGMTLTLCCNTQLYHMEDGSTIIRAYRDTILILILEFAVMTALMLVFSYINEKRKAKD